MFTLTPSVMQQLLSLAGIVLAKLLAPETLNLQQCVSYRKLAPVCGVQLPC